jgi:hypothetical protein
MVRLGPSTLPCPQLTIQKVWHTLQSHAALGPGEAGPGCPPGGMYRLLGCPGHQVYGPSGRAWAVPAPGPKVASPRPPDTNAVVANPTIPRFINLGLFSAAAPRVLGIRVNRDDRFMLVHLVAVEPWSALQQVDTARAATDPNISRTGAGDVQRCAARRSAYLRVLGSAGADMKLLQVTMGHASIMVTAHTYADLYDSDLDRVADALDQQY